ncbi:MAG: peptidoglycan bridge formation glycyltransferase FemA/FemB family protein [Bacteroidales bacterium]|nr:peptidoglycan bridge formation glycyltransferase FemA/FemB family protein [Bacteroidales bacterium]
MKISKIVHNIDKNKWYQFVYNHPDANIFQTPYIFDVYNNTDNYEPISLIVLDENEKIIGVLLAVIQYFSKGIHILSSRSLIIGGPLIKNDDKKVLSEILNFYNKIIRKKAIFTEIRNHRNFRKLKVVFKEQGYDFIEHLNIIINTKIGDSIKKNISKSKLRQIKKGLDLGAEIIEPESLDQVKEFYNILNYLYKHKIKKPIPDWSFFENYYKLGKTNNICKYFFIKYDNKIVGGIMTPILPKKVIYELYVCGLDEDYKEIYPSVLATWAAIDFAANNEIKKFDFMGAGKPYFYYGVREFKEKFGGHLYNYGRFQLIHQPLKYKTAKFGFKIWKIINLGKRN